MYKGLKVAVVIPAHDEALAIAKVVAGLLALKGPDAEPVVDDLVVCDNASTDGTAEAARVAGARVVRQEELGYGVACLTALAETAPADVVLFVDGDDSCKVEQAIRLLDGIAAGDDLAIGSRVLGDMERGALAPVQRFGNALSAGLIRLIWGVRITDLGPFRAIRTSALESIAMVDRRFGWTVEMQIKAIQLGLRMGEYPVDSTVRIGRSKISGTVKGSVLAGVGILSKIFVLRLRQANLRATAGVKAP